VATNKYQKYICERTRLFDTGVSSVLYAEYNSSTGDLIVSFG